MDEIMCSIDKKNKKFVDRIDKENLITISDIKKIFDSYNHDDIRRYEHSIVWYDVGSLFFLVYIKRKFGDICEIHIDEKEVFREDGNTFLEWLEHIDYSMDDKDNPKCLIYYKNQEFYYDAKLLTKSNKLQVHIVSHSFAVGSGHLGCLFIKNKNVYYYDPNGLKDADDENYYDVFEKKLCEEMLKYGLVYSPYRWKKGIQVIQDNEESKYRMDIMGMCCAWTYLIIELKLMNPGLMIEEIENKLKKKYRYRLTRMIVTYQQDMHKILFNLAMENFSRK